MRTLSFLALISLPACAATQTLTHGDFRVQVLSPTLVRIEQRGPNGFEDRPTFRVQQRNWPGIGSDWHVLDSGVESKNWRIRFPADTTKIDQIEIRDKSGNLLIRPGQQRNRAWLPSPASKPSVWAFADAPRLTPPIWGATPAPTDVANSGWDTSNNATDIYVFLPGGDYRQLRKDFLTLTGQTEMPPLYMFGYIDSKWYPYTQTEAIDRVKEYRKRDIPLDVLVMDTDWRIGASHGYGPNTKLLPDVPKLFNDIHALGAKVMFNDHPEPQAPSALDAKEMEYRWNGLGTLLKEGLDVWWFDRNWGVSLREPLPGLRHEVWGMQVYRDMTLKAKPDLRPVIMANVDGIDNGARNGPPDVAAHRFPVQWTGDTQPTWESLRRAVENSVYSGVMSLNPYVNDDLGGHTAMPGKDLYLRFMQYGSLCPVMRPHCTYKLERAPWYFGTDAESIVRDYTQLRYRLMPLLYASGRKAYDTGEPILRRLDLDYPTFAQASRDDQYLLGTDLLVAPIVGSSAHEALSPKLVHTPAGQPGLAAEYFANEKLTGTPTVARTDATLSFGWGDGSPAPGMPGDHFSARWTGKLGPIPGNTPRKLVVTADDGVRVWLDGKLVLDKWVPQNSVTNEVPQPLIPGKTYDLKVEYFEADGGALITMGTQEAAPISSRDVWVPTGTWTDLWSGKRIVGPKTIQAQETIDRMPLFVRDGAILALAPKMAYTGQKAWTPLTLEVFPGKGAFELYEDDGASNAYKKGAFRKTSMTLAGTTLTIAPARGTYRPRGPFAENRSYAVRFHIGQRSATGVSVDGTPVKGWKAIPAGAAFPLKGNGRSPEGTVIEVQIPSGTVTKGHTVRVLTGK